MFLLIELVVKICFCTEFASAEAAHSTIIRLIASSSTNTTAGNSLDNLATAMANYRNALSGTNVFTPLDNANGTSVANTNAEGTPSLLHKPRNDYRNPPLRNDRAL